MDIMYSRHLAERMAENIGRMIKEERERQGWDGDAAGGPRGEGSGRGGSGKRPPGAAGSGGPKRASSVRFSDEDGGDEHLPR